MTLSADLLAEVWAKSPRTPGGIGESLVDHSVATRDRGRDVLARVGRIPGMPDWFDVVALAAALGHDAGKCLAGFQRWLHDHEDWWGQRHEVFSLGFLPYLGIDDPETEAWVAAAIVTHHRPLTSPRPGRGVLQRYDDTSPTHLVAEFAQDSQTAVAVADWLAHITGTVSGPGASPQELGNRIRQALDAVDARFGLSVAPPVGLTAVLLQGAVTMADHLASAHIRLDTDSPVPAWPGRWLAGTVIPRAHQQAAAAVAGGLLLRAPTGSGKTEAVLWWAANAINELAARHGGVPRLIYTLPYLASINAMVIRLRRELDVPIGVLHSKALAFHLRHDDRDDRVQAARAAVAVDNAARLHQHTVRVATPYQLLRGALAGTAWSATLLDSATSVIVFDELHAYEPRRLGMMLAMMGMWTRLGSQVAILSATLPDRLEDLLRETLGSLTPVDGHATHDSPARHRIQLGDGHLTDATSIAAIETDLRAGRSVLVVANTVDDATLLFDRLAPLACEIFGPDGAVLLHSRFTATDRGRIEDTIISRHGASSPTRAPGLVVATQCVEVSLDISLDVLHTSAAPLEALLQRFGRINRLALAAAAPVIVYPAREVPGRNPGEVVSDYVYDAHLVRAAWQVMTVHNGLTVDEKLTQRWVNGIYSGDWGARWEDAVRAARDEFDRDFLTFTEPFDDRSELDDRFQTLFDGVEGIWEGHRDAYHTALATAPNATIGRVVAADYLIPLGSRDCARSRWDADLGVRVVPGNYCPARGLNPHGC